MAGCRFSEEIKVCGEPAREYVRINDGASSRIYTNFLLVIFVKISNLVGFQMMNKKTFLLFGICSLAFIILPQIAAARIVPECNGPCKLCDFFLLIKNIYDFIVFKLAPPIAGILIVVAGALFLVSGGSEERVSQAKKIFINVIIGLVFIYASWLIVNSIIQVIGKSTEGFNPKSWWEFTCKK